MAYAASAASAADTVHVILVGVRLREVNHMGDVDDVNTAGSDIGGDQDFGLAALEAFQGALALPLGLAAVDGVSREAAGHQLVAEALDAALGFVEYDDLGEFLLE